MKPITTTALAVVLAASAASATAAQYGSAATQQTQNRPQATQAPAQVTQKAEARASKKALNAIVALQTAVNNQYVANIPAKLAAAQAVAETKEDR